MLTRFQAHLKPELALTLKALIYQRWRNRTALELSAIPRLEPPWLAMPGLRVTLIHRNLVEALKIRSPIRRLVAARSTRNPDSARGRHHKNRLTIRFLEVP